MGRKMFRRTFKSTSGKIAGAALALAGMVGGWTLTAELGAFQLASTSVVAGDGTGYQSAVALDFPMAVLPADEDVRPGATQTMVESMGNMEISYEVPVVAPSPPAVPPAPECVAELTSAVAGLVGSVAGIVTAEHAAGALEQINALGIAANTCADEVSTSGSAGMDQLAQVGEELNGLVGTIQALAVPTTPTATDDESADLIGNPVEKTLSVVGGGLGMTLDAVNGITGPVGGLLGYLLNPTRQER